MFSVMLPGKFFPYYFFFSVLAYVNVLLMSNPRVMYAMAEDGVFPGLFAGKIHPPVCWLRSLTAFAIGMRICYFLDEGIR